MKRVTPNLCTDDPADMITYSAISSSATAAGEDYCQKKPFTANTHGRLPERALLYHFSA